MDMGGIWQGVADILKEGIDTYQKIILQREQVKQQKQLMETQAKTQAEIERLKAKKLVMLGSTLMLASIGLYMLKEAKII